MMNDYFLNQQYRSPSKKMQTSGSFGFRSSQFSQKNNNSINGQAKNMDPSFFNESSIRKLNTSESGQFIYFKNDSVLSELQLELENKKKHSLKQSSALKKKKQVMNSSGEIQFDDSLQKSNDHESSKIKEYGTGKSNLPPTLKKPKFAFKTSQTAESSTIMKDAQNSVVTNQVGQQYQLKGSKKLVSKSRSINEEEMSKQLALENSNSIRQKQCLLIKQKNQFREYKEKEFQNQNSISSIKHPYQQPSIISKSLSKSNSLNGSMNFKSVFKHRIQKASVINSSLNKKYNGVKSNNSILSHKSISKNHLHQKEVNIAELNDLRQLQNKLGKLKHQNKKIIEYMIEKDQEIERLCKKKIQIESQDPYAIIKQNQLMKVFLNKNKTKNSNKNITSEQDYGYTKCLRSAKSFKQLSLKKNSHISSLHDYDVTEHKFKVQARQLIKNEKKIILSNRGILLSEKYLDVGYSLKDNVLTLYLTLKKEYDEVGIKLEEKSFILSDPIERAFHDSTVGKQIKFKTEIKSTKCKNTQDDFSSPCLKISLSTQHKFQTQTKQFKVQLPITVYNISKQIQGTQNVNSQSIQKSSRLNAKQIFKTQSFVACKDMIRDPQGFLMRLFPMGTFFKERNQFQIGFIWKEKQDFLKIRIKERSFVIEGEGNPNVSTFQLLRSIISLLIEERKEE